MFETNNQYIYVYIYNTSVSSGCSVAFTAIWSHPQHSREAASGLARYIRRTCKAEASRSNPEPWSKNRPWKDKGDLSHLKKKNIYMCMHVYIFIYIMRVFSGIFAKIPINRLDLILIFCILWTSHDHHGCKHRDGAINLQSVVGEATQMLYVWIGTSLDLMMDLSHGKIIYKMEDVLLILMFSLW